MVRGTIKINYHRHHYQPHPFANLSQSRVRIAMQNKALLRWIPLGILVIVSSTLSVSFWYLPSMMLSTGQRSTSSMSVHHAVAKHASFVSHQTNIHDLEPDPHISDLSPSDQVKGTDRDEYSQTSRADDGPPGKSQPLLDASTPSTKDGESPPTTDESRGTKPSPDASEEVHHADLHSRDSELNHPVEMGYVSKEEEHRRSERFPSINERVKVYMTNWYLPPCDPNHSESFVQYTFFNDSKQMIFREARTAKEKIRGPLRTFLINATNEFDIMHFVRSTDEFQKDCNNAYCNDMIRYLFPAVSDKNITAPVVYQFSDAEKTRAFSLSKGRTVAYPNIPEFKKFRYALSSTERNRVLEGNCSTSPRAVPLTLEQEVASGKVIATSQPIVFKLKMQRHYGYIKSVPDQDRPWSKKKNQAVFRGQFTGRFPYGMQNVHSLPVQEQCQLLPRCRLVYNSAIAAQKRQARGEAPLVDAKLALPVLNVRKDFPMQLDNVNLYGERMSIEEILSYKAIIMLEGNDVSSGLKWALFSESVVLTSTPTKTSWAMEELLEPWVHYIPLADDLSDVESKMQWIVDNDDEAYEIAKRGRLWISDLVFHPDADRDEEEIFRQIVDRYQEHFRPNKTLFNGVSGMINTVTT